LPVELVDGRAAAVAGGVELAGRLLEMDVNGTGPVTVCRRLAGLANDGSEAANGDAE